MRATDLMIPRSDLPPHIMGGYTMKLNEGCGKWCVLHGEELALLEPKRVRVCSHVYEIPPPAGVERAWVFQKTVGGNYELYYLTDNHIYLAAERGISLETPNTYRRFSHTIPDVESLVYPGYVWSRDDMEGVEHWRNVFRASYYPDCESSSTRGGVEETAVVSYGQFNLSREIKQAELAAIMGGDARIALQAIDQWANMGEQIGEPGRNVTVSVRADFMDWHDHRQKGDGDPDKGRYYKDREVYFYGRVGTSKHADRNTPLGPIGWQKDRNGVPLRRTVAETIDRESRFVADIGGIKHCGLDS